MNKIVLPTLLPVDVEPMSSYRITSPIKSPQDDFVLTWFQIDDAVAENFLITDVKIGKNSQFVSVGCVPASLFSLASAAKFTPDQVGLLFDPVKSGTTITIDITNVSPRRQTFSAKLVGYRQVDLPRAAYCYVMGYGSTLVQDHHSVNISVQPMVNFQPRFLYVPESALQLFQLDDLRTLDLNRRSSGQSVEKLKGMPQSGPIQLVPDPYVSSDQFLTLSARNITDHPHNFTAAILGTPVPTHQETP